MDVESLMVARGNIVKKIAFCGNDCSECDLSFKSFEKTKIYSESIKGKCNDEDYQMCYKAFFLKKDNLDNARSY